MEFRIQRLIESRDYSTLRDYCEELELQEKSLGNEQHETLLAVELATLLILNDLPNAKYLWKRIPARLKLDGTQISCIWAVGKCLWKKNYSSVYTALNQPWKGDVHTLMIELEGAVRTRTLELLSKSYSSISGSDLASHLGLALEEAAAYALSAGWTRDGDYFIVPLKVAHTKTTVNPTQLSELTSYITHLEK